MPKTEVCRLCLHQAITSCSLLQNNSSKMLESLTSIKVDPSNEFSTISCFKCYLDLKLAYKIQQKFLSTNEKLKDILQRNTLKEEVVETIKCEETILSKENDDPLSISSDENNSNQEREQLNENYQCIYCDKRFVSKEEYTEHVSSHSQTILYPEKKRKLKANENLEDILQRNIMKKEVVETIKCEEIMLNEETDDPLSISSDENNTNQEKGQLNESNQCIYCDKMFGSKEEYTEHVLSHSQTILYECTHCDSKYLKESLLNTHFQNVHCKFNKQNDPQLKKDDMLLVSEKDDDNNKKQVKPKKLDLQIKGLSDKLNKLNQTSTADELFHNQTQKPTLTKSGPYVCKTCGKKFALRRMFQNHCRYHNFSKRKPCPICKKEITTYNLSKHIKMHDDKPKICETCGKTYANIESLRGHIFDKHRGKHYECKQCNVTFNKRQSLNSHCKKQHTGTPSYICETCGRKFFFAYDLKKHIQCTHLKMRPYVCEFCHRGFSTLGSMKTHRRQHTNETPYRCEECGEGFRQNVSLKTHKKSKHNIVETITSECKICGKGFASEHAVKSHMRLH